MKIMGLDISTSVVGVTILDENFNVELMTHISFKSSMNFWEKADHALEQFWEIFDKHGAMHVVYVEEPVLSYSPGKSSAQTIMTLAKFNYILSYEIRLHQNRDPIHITVGEARKTCGIKTVQRKKAGGLSHKEQTFKYLTSPGQPLHGVPFPKTKNGTYKNYVADEVDSYVIARAGVILASSLNRPNL